MPIQPTLQTIRSDLEGLIHSVDSTSLDKNEITSKVQSILTSSSSICEDPAIMGLFKNLETSLELHGLKDLSQKVDQLVVTRQKSEQTITNFQRTFKAYQEVAKFIIGGYFCREIRALQPTAQELLQALKSLSGWENHMETRLALLELKGLLDIREKEAGLSKSWGFSLLGSYYSAEASLLQLLQKSPEKFGLTA